MSNWAEINDNNIVIRVLSCGNAPIVPDEGESWLNTTFGGRWIKTSYNTIGGKHMRGGEPLRKNYAGIGYMYVEDIDAFVPPKPDSGSWYLDPETALWRPLGESAIDGDLLWDTETYSWKLVSNTDRPI